MTIVKKTYLLCMGLMLSGCASTAVDGLHRNCSIGLINVPVESLADMKIKAGSFQVDRDALRGAAQSRGKNESTYEWWPRGGAPELIEFNLTFKNGAQIIRSRTIETSYYNRFGITGVYLVNRDNQYSVEIRYGFVSEYESHRTHLGEVNTWLFDDSGNLLTINHTQYMQDSRICLFYTNHSDNVVFQQISYVNDAQPYVYLYYAAGGQIQEIEVYHHNHPQEFRVHYGADKTIKKVTKNAVTYHPGGVLRQKVAEVDITDQPLLYQECKFPDLDFLNLIDFNLEHELKTRNIVLGKKEDPNKMVVRNVANAPSLTTDVG